MTVANLFVVNDNIGDAASAPMNYFRFPFDVKRVPLSPTAKIHGHAIFGGGGQFHFPWLGALVRSVPGMKIAWGIGSNEHGQHHVSYPDSILDFNIVGVRDWNTGFHWVPCASCMLPALGVNYEIQREAVALESIHSDIPLPKLDMPHKSNNDFTGPNELIAFLASAKVIVTNSYHAAYWGTLLGRKVVAMPVSSKFYGLRYLPVFSNCEDWRSDARQAQIYPDALAECREANRMFFTLISTLQPIHD